MFVTEAPPAEVGAQAGEAQSALRDGPAAPWLDHITFLPLPWAAHAFALVAGYIAGHRQAGPQTGGATNRRLRVLFSTPSTP
jgi:hypothetical protein